MTVPELRQYLRINADFPSAALADYKSQFLVSLRPALERIGGNPGGKPDCGRIFPTTLLWEALLEASYYLLRLFAAGNICMALGAGARIPRSPQPGSSPPVLRSRHIF